MKPWLRWIFVLPAAIGAFAGVQMLIITGSLIGIVDSSGGNLWIQFISAVLCPVAFVWCGSKTAPAYRFFTSICLTVLFSMLATILATLVFTHTVETKSSNGWLAICALAGIISSIVTCYAIHEKEKADREAELNEWSVKGALAGENARKKLEEIEKSESSKFSNN